MDLEQTAKQTEFAELVGVSQPAIAKMISVGALTHGETYLQWLHAYCERLRVEAAGRQVNQTRLDLEKAKTRDAIASAETKELALYRERGLVFEREQVKNAFENWIAVAKAEYMNSIDKIIAGIESQNSVTVDREFTDGIIGAAFRVIADYSVESVEPR